MNGYFKFMKKVTRHMAHCILNIDYSGFMWRFSMALRRTWIEFKFIYYAFRYLNFYCIRDKHIYAYSHVSHGVTYSHCVSCGHVIREEEIKK